AGSNRQDRSPLETISSMRVMSDTQLPCSASFLPPQQPSEPTSVPLGHTHSSSTWRANRPTSNVALLLSNSCAYVNSALSKTERLRPALRTNPLSSNEPNSGPASRASLRLLIAARRRGACDGPA